VVTGLGAVTCLGSQVSRVWGRLIAGDSGVRHLYEFDHHKFTSRVAAPVPIGTGEFDFSPDRW